VVVADGEARRDALGEAAEAAPHTLAQRLESFEAVRVPGGVEADALGAAVVDGDEDRRLALASPGGGEVRPPTSRPRRPG
jgi:hypothetical protein